MSDRDASLPRGGGADAAPADAGEGWIIAPDPEAPGLTRAVIGRDHTGAEVETRVVEERAWTLWLNRREVVTLMTVGDLPRELAVGYLVNQGMLEEGEIPLSVELDPEAEAVVVRTAEETDFEAKMARRIRTSGCAVGTVFGDVMERFEGVRLPEGEVRVSDLMALTAMIARMPSLYLAAGAIHGAALCAGRRGLVYVEDVGRHNAVDKIAGWMRLNAVGGGDKLLHTTGRLTSEMVIKTALMGIPALASRSGFTAEGVALARACGLTLIGRLKGSRFLCLSGEGRLVRDVAAEDRGEDPRHVRKGAREG